MRITAKGQMTILARLRQRLGLLPSAEVAIAETNDGASIRPILSRQELIEQRMRKARGVAPSGLTTDEILQLTRGDD